MGGLRGGSFTAKRSPVSHNSNYRAETREITLSGLLFRGDTMSEPTTSTSVTEPAIGPGLDQAEQGAWQAFNAPLSDVAPVKTEPVGKSGLEEPERPPMRSAEVAIGIIAMLLWLLFFTLGTTVNTAPHRAALQSAPDLASWLGSAGIVFTCYTVTNIALLASLAAATGEFSQRSRSSEFLMSRQSRPVPALHDVCAYYASASLRGFVVYLLGVSGLLLITTDAIANAQQDQYVRLAGTVSVVAFIAGYDVQVFKRVLERIVSLISREETRKP
jgi:hypothetical protein